MYAAKFVAAIVGMIVLWLKQNTNIDIGDQTTQQITDYIVEVLIPLIIYAVPNKEAAK